MTKIKTALVPILILIAGLFLMGIESYIPSSWVPSWLAMLLIFIIFNVVIAKYLGLLHRLGSVWSVAKAWHVIPGFLIGSLPIGIAYLRS